MSIALVDCNNFYASCERVFNAKLHGKPVVVLSNNDGCAIAMSNEAKALGVVMGTPYFQLKSLIKAHEIFVFSSNYTLYGDLSNRVMKTLETFPPPIEVYSIDEAFLSLERIRAEHEALAREIRARVKQWTGIPVSVGIASTKTLAKVANRIAKKNLEHKGVFDLTKVSCLDSVLSQIAVQDIWGIGRQYAAYLRSHNIFSALDFAAAPDRWIKKNLTVMGLRTAMELRGTSCISLELAPASKKSIACTRSFGKSVTRLEELEEAVSSYTARAAEKLRTQKSVVEVIQVFIRTNYFKTDSPQYSKSTVISLPYPTSNTSMLIEYTVAALKGIYKEGFEYAKAGVIFSGICTSSFIQQNLFVAESDRDKKLIALVDKVNNKIGRNTLYFGAMGKPSPSWRMRQSMRSPRYTTNFKELLCIRI